MKVRQKIDYNWPEFEKILNQKDFKSLFKDLQKNDEVSDEMVESFSLAADFDL